MILRINIANHSENKAPGSFQFDLKHNCTRLVRDAACLTSLCNFPYAYSVLSIAPVGKTSAFSI